MRGYFFKTPKWLKMLYPALVWDKSGIGKSPSLYLTFDDGPIPEVTPWVLEQLKKYEVKATFFQVGDNLRKYPDIFRRVLAEGHRVGNHSYNHLNGWKTNEIDYFSNVKECQEAIESLGAETNLFRPPYGKISRKQIKTLKTDFKIVMWDYLSGDFDHDLNVDLMIKNFKKKVKPGAIVVFHDNVKSFDSLKKALPEFLDFFKGRGYHFLTL